MRALTHKSRWPPSDTEGWKSAQGQDRLPQLLRNACCRWKQFWNKPLSCRDYLRTASFTVWSWFTTHSSACPVTTKLFTDVGEPRHRHHIYLRAQLSPPCSSSLRLLEQDKAWAASWVGNSSQKTSCLHEDEADVPRQSTQPDTDTWEIQTQT